MIDTRFLRTLIDKPVRVYPEKGSRRRPHIGKLVSVSDAEDPVLTVHVGSTDFQTPWSEVARLQVDTVIAHP